MPAMAKIWSRPQTLDLRNAANGSENCSGMKPRVTGSSPVGRASFFSQRNIKSIMVDVAQLVERRIVTPVVVGSIPIVHPIFNTL